MADIRNYLKLSKIAKSVVDIYAKPKEFAENYKNILGKEKKSYLRHYLINNKPFAFANAPLIYEQVIQYFADNIGVNPSQIKLIGSGKTGFSISESNYGKPYQSEKSDLDFLIVNEDLFYALQTEFERWANLYNSGQIKPAKNREQIFWPENLNTGVRQFKRGFIDTKFIPNRDPFPKTKEIDSSLFYIKKYLSEISHIEIKEASVRIYRDWNSFMRQLQINTEEVITRAT